MKHDFKDFLTGNEGYCLSRVIFEGFLKYLWLTSEIIKNMNMLILNIYITSSAEFVFPKYVYAELFSLQ